MNFFPHEHMCYTVQVKGINCPGRFNMFLLSTLKNQTGRIERGCRLVLDKARDIVTVHSLLLTHQKEMQQWCAARLVRSAANISLCYIVPKGVSPFQVNLCDENTVCRTSEVWNVNSTFNTIMCKQIIYRYLRML